MLFDVRGSFLNDRLLISINIKRLLKNINSCISNCTKPQRIQPGVFSYVAYFISSFYRAEESTLHPENASADAPPGTFARKKGRTAKTCFARKEHNQAPARVHTVEEDTLQDVDTVYHVQQTWSLADPPYEMVLNVDGHPVKFELGLGASSILINESTKSTALRWSSSRRTYCKNMPRCVETKTTQLSIDRQPSLSSKFGCHSQFVKACTVPMQWHRRLKMNRAANRICGDYKLTANIAIKRNN